MTALWIALIFVLTVTIANGLVAFILWCYCAGLTTMLKSHTKDEKQHFATDWEDDADA